MKDHTHTRHCTADAALYNILRAAVLLSLALLLFAATARAQEAQQPEEGLGYAFAGGYYQAKAGVGDRDEGEMGVRGFALGLGLGGVDFAYATTAYSWEDVSQLPFGNGKDDPWKRLHLVSLGAEHSQMLDDRWGWFAGAAVGAAYEEEISGSFGGALYGGGIYAWDENVSLLFGLAGGLHRIGLGLMPLFTVQWNYVGEEGSGWYGEAGLPNTTVGYAFSESFSMDLGLECAGETYRLADDSTVRRRGYVQFEEMAASLMVNWDVADGLRLSAGPTYSFARELTFYDKDGDETDDHVLDNAAGAALNVVYMF